MAPHNGPQPAWIICGCGDQYDLNSPDHDCDYLRQRRERLHEQALSTARTLTDDDLLSLLVERGALRFYSFCSMHQDPQDDCENCQVGSWGLDRFNGRWATRSATPEA